MISGLAFLPISPLFVDFALRHQPHPDPSHLNIWHICNHNRQITFLHNSLHELARCEYYTLLTSSTICPFFFLILYRPHFLFSLMPSAFVLLAIFTFSPSTYYYLFLMWFPRRRRSSSLILPSCCQLYHQCLHSDNKYSQFVLIFVR